MAEQPDLADRPSGAPAPPAGEAAPAFPPDPAAPAEEPYRTLSVLALIGFGVAALYAVVVVLMGAVALLSGKPLLLSGWTLMIPAAAAALCLVARARINRSEGTLAGAALAGWGVLLCLFVGLGFWAYSMAVSFALAQQSERFTREWLDLIRQNKLEQAAYYTLPPPQRGDMRPDDPALRSKLELRQVGATGPEAMGGGAFSQLTQTGLVRTITQFGEEATVESRGVKEWEYTEGGFRVMQAYTVSTPESTFEALVTVHGSESAKKPGRREWFVVMGHTGFNEQEGPVQYNERGRHMLTLAHQAATLVQNWRQALGRGYRPESFLLTLPEERRDQARAALERAVAVGAAAGPLPAFRPEAGPEALREYHRYRQGVLVSSDPSGFVSAPDGEKQALEAGRGLFSGGPETFAPVLDMARTQPVRSLAGGALRYHFDVSFGARPASRVSAVATVEGDARAADAKDRPARWRLVGLKMTGIRDVRTGPDAPMQGEPP